MNDSHEALLSIPGEVSPAILAEQIAWFCEYYGAEQVGEAEEVESRREGCRTWRVWTTRPTKNSSLAEAS